LIGSPFGSGTPGTPTHYGATPPRKSKGFFFSFLVEKELPFVRFVRPLVVQETILERVID